MAGCAVQCVADRHPAGGHGPSSSGVNGESLPGVRDVRETVSAKKQRSVRVTQVKHIPRVPGPRNSTLLSYPDQGTVHYCPTRTKEQYIIGTSVSSFIHPINSKIYNMTIEMYCLIYNLITFQFSVHTDAFWSVMQ